MAELLTTEPMTPDERIALLEREVSAAQYRIERDGAEIERLRNIIDVAQATLDLAASPDDVVPNDNCPRVTWDREDANSNWRIFVNGDFHGRAGMVEGLLVAEIDRLRSQLTDFHNVDDVGEIRRLRAENEQLRTEYAACIATVDRLENGSAADVGEKP